MQNWETAVATRNHLVQQICECLSEFQVWIHNQKIQFLLMESSIDKQMNILTTHYTK